jgi:preprotein translocase subunit SecA
MGQPPVSARAALPAAGGAATAVAPEPEQEIQLPKVTVRRDVPKVGRNDPCPCGSGKKFKQCHGR